MSVLKAMDAMNAYAGGLARIGGPAELGKGGPSAQKALSGGSGFADVLKETVGNLQQVTKAAESASIAGINGSMNLVDVVTAVSNAEMMVETVVTVRDKVIQSYQEIMRMPI